MITHEEVLTVLRDEALDNPELGWLSDMGNWNLEYDESSGSIRVGGNGSIDLSHLASIVIELISGDRP